MNKKSVLEMIRPLISEAVATILALLILALLMLKMEWGSKPIGGAVLVVYGIACFLGGWSAGRHTGKKKFLAGLVYGALYFVLLMGGGQPSGDTSRICTAFAVCAMAGMAGGMFSGFVGKA